MGTSVLLTVAIVCGLAGGGIIAECVYHSRQHGTEWLARRHPDRGIAELGGGLLFLAFLAICGLL